MTQSSWPFDNGLDTSEQQYSTLLRKISDTGVEGGSATSDLKAYADSSGLFVKVPAGRALVQGFQYSNTDVVVLPIVPGDTLPRVDTIVLRLNTLLNTIVLDVKKGDPAASPSSPALVQVDNPIGVWEEAVADVAVSASSTVVAAGDVTDRRRFTSEPWGVWTTASRPRSPRRGKAGFNETTGKPEYHNGSAWVEFGSGSTSTTPSTTTTTPTTTVTPGGTLGTSLLQFPQGVSDATPATSASQLGRVGMLVHLSLAVNVGNSGATTGSTVCVIPDGWRPVANEDYDIRTSDNQVIQMAVEPNGNVRVRYGTVGANKFIYGAMDWLNY